MDLILPYLTPANIVTYLAAVSFIAFAAFGIDKARAENGARRTSEADLLFFALIGGTLGAYAGRALFRHKTRKQPFSSRLHGIALFQIAAAVILLVLPD
ncbi:hypothetical protein GCM10023115_07450 [Pontixanthobacter gangjinensis]|uniref:DUF1294 domain-containing protein n=1 Tax=Pontixanthobacter gangjinensis TaxID=1028742 RepID=A0A6I4SJX1_9SPHN|nr:DUF1294 domain-containing protein [Pontixanthobacter gangjinensis]MXO55993.1 DUF1294 domain-containing protein [Pontixanthobacter gangjinensis]